jgi:tRNA A37 threonylcarbamoyladenosine dehydratase
VFSRECVIQPSAVSEADAEGSALNDSSLNCHGYGSVVSVTSTFGMCAAGWALDQAAGFTQLSQASRKGPKSTLQ